MIIYRDLHKMKMGVRNMIVIFKNFLLIYFYFMIKLKHVMFFK